MQIYIILPHYHLTTLQLMPYNDKRAHVRVTLCHVHRSGLTESRGQYMSKCHRAGEINARDAFFFS